MEGTFSLQSLLQRLPVIGVHKLPEQLGVGIKFLGGVTEHILDCRAYIFKDWPRGKTISVDHVLGVLHQLPKSDLGLMQFPLNILSLCFAFAQFLSEELDGDLLDGLLYVSFRQYVSPLDLS